MADVDLNTYFSFSWSDLLQIWRIEKLTPVKVASPSGLFYKGDSYILLKKNPEQRTYTAHHWIGSQSSQDEYGAAAILVVKLASLIGQKVNIYQEWEANESVLFLSYFPSGVQYLDGGIDTAFNHFEPAKYKPRLLQVKGCKHIRISQVPLSGDSLNENDAFILDNGLELFLWIGQTANKQERAKSAFAVTSIRNNERNGQATIRYPRDNAEDDKAFWGLLGGNKPASIKAEADLKDEDIDIVTLSKEIRLFEVSDAEGSLKKKEIEERPLVKEMLNSEETYVLVLERDIYVWTGRKSTTQEKESGMKIAREFAEEMGKKKCVRCVRVFEGMEDIVFKMNFSNWSTCALRPSQTLMEAAKEKTNVEQVAIDFEKIHKNIQESMCDSFGDITEKQLTVHVIYEKELKPLCKGDYGHFFSEDCYVIDFLYKQKNKQFRVLYYWLGQHTTIERQTACAFHVAKLTQESKVKVSNVRVPMTKEPSEFFVHVFADTGFMIHKGHYQELSAFWNQRETPRFYHLHSSHVINTLAIEIERSGSNLNSGDAFLLFTKDSVRLWAGSGAHKEELALGTKLGNQYCLGRSFETVQEGKEPEDFWAVLGGKSDYPKVSKIEYATIEPRLFVLSDISGSLKAEEIRSFSQTDLSNDDVALLDAFYEVFLWIGGGANENEKKLVEETARKYLESAKDGRKADDCSICSVFAGKETLNFTKYFKGWDWHLSELNDFKDPYLAMKEKYSKKSEVEEKKEEEKPKAVASTASSEFLDPKTNKFSLQDLQNNVPKGVNPARREDYLDDKAFEQVFKVKREEFEKFKDWKQRDLKKANKLF